MTILEQEQKLFADWKSQREYKSFTIDGVFDEEIYLKQKTKILYVLKEADWPEYKGDLNLKEYLLSEKSKNYWRTWNNIARWTKGIIEGGEYQKYISKSDKTYWLKKIAFIELKKTTGSANSDDDEIAYYAKQDSKFIFKQIEMYSPDIIICCGRGTGKNADLLYDYVFPKVSLSNWKDPLTKNKYNYYVVNLCNKDIPVISFVHPQMWGNHEKFKQRYRAIIEIKDALL